jgi:hypothetical protein
LRFLRRFGERGDAPVGRIDQQRRAFASVDRREMRAGIEPEIVVAADVAVRPRRSIAARRRRGAVGVDRRVELFAALGDLLLAFLRLFVGQHQRAAGAALERRDRAEIVRALQIGMTVRHARHAARRRHRFFRGRRLPGDVYVCHGNRRRGDRDDCDARQESVTHVSTSLPRRFYICAVQIRAAIRYYRSLTVTRRRDCYPDSYI